MQATTELGDQVTGWKRRTFVKAAALLGVANAREGYAQQARRLPSSIKILVVGGAPQNLGPQGLVQGLEEHGLIADRDYSILYHGEGLSFGPPELQQERPDIIFAVGSRGVRMAKGATSTVPIIALDLESEPLSEGLIARFSRPGGNLTGLFLDQPAMAAKWLQYLTDTLPGLAQVAVLRQPGFAAGQWSAVQAEAARRQLTLRLFEFEANTLERALAEVAAWPAQAFIVLSSPLVVLSRTVLADRALAARLPSITMFRVYAEAGGLLAYGPDPITMGNRAASYVVRVLRGALPGDLPAEQPSRFELAVNLGTARALGLSVPHWIMAGADATFD